MKKTNTSLHDGVHCEYYRFCHQPLCILTCNTLWLIHVSHWTISKHWRTHCRTHCCRPHTPWCSHASAMVVQRNGLSTEQHYGCISMEAPIGKQLKNDSDVETLRMEGHGHKQLYITEKLVRRFGATAGCKECDRQVRIINGDPSLPWRRCPDAPWSPHTLACRERFRMLLNDYGDPSINSDADQKDGCHDSPCPKRLKLTRTDTSGSLADSSTHAGSSSQASNHSATGSDADHTDEEESRVMNLLESWTLSEPVCIGHPGLAFIQQHPDVALDIVRRVPKVIRGIQEFRDILAQGPETLGWEALCFPICQFPKQ